MCGNTPLRVTQTPITLSIVPTFRSHHVDPIWGSAAVALAHRIGQRLCEARGYYKDKFDFFNPQMGPVCLSISAPSRHSEVGSRENIREPNRKSAANIFNLSSLSERLHATFDPVLHSLTRDLLETRSMRAVQFPSDPFPSLGQFWTPRIPRSPQRVVTEPRNLSPGL